MATSPGNITGLHIFCQVPYLCGFHSPATRGLGFLEVSWSVSLPQETQGTQLTPEAAQHRAKKLGPAQWSAVSRFPCSGVTPFSFQGRDSALSGDDFLPQLTVSTFQGVIAIFFSAGTKHSTPQI